MYTVHGKGGLVREVRIPNHLAERLEERRLETPERVTDRGIHYETRYDIAGGKNWSNSFSAASERTLGFSNGAHGLRHSYAQERMSELAEKGLEREQALRSEEHTSELQSRPHLVCRLLLEKKKKKKRRKQPRQ